ncbi:MAG: hypothetical protein MZW92_69020 [Comamonadaceae bacterium]|nr:hypothetical protein [Comamonadaceae bacterium]
MRKRRRGRDARRGAAAGSAWPSWLHARAASAGVVRTRTSPRAPRAEDVSGTASSSAGRAGLPLGSRQAG